MTTRFSYFGQNNVFSAISHFLLIIIIFIAKKALWSDSMINQAKSKRNSDVFLNFVADLPESRGYKISDNVFLSFNFSELAHVTSLVIGKKKN